jgi:hypothetical protein
MLELPFRLIMFMIADHFLKTLCEMISWMLTNKHQVDPFIANSTGLLIQLCGVALCILWLFKGLIYTQNR